MIRNKIIVSLFFMFFCFAILLSMACPVHAAPEMRGDSGTAASDSVTADTSAATEGDTTDGMTMPETNNNDVTSDQATLDLMPDTSDKATTPVPSTSNTGSDTVTDATDTNEENKAEVLGIIVAVIIAVAVIILVVLIMSKTRGSRL